LPRPLLGRTMFSSVGMDKSIQISINLQNLYVVLGVLAVAVLISLVFKKSRQWFKRRYKELDFLREYIKLAGLQWQALLWGGSVLALAFGWHFVTTDWPYPVKVTACVTALFFAGYYLWRANRIRLIPKLGIGDVSLIWTDTGLPNQKRRYIQVPVKCETESPIKNCRGQLLRVSRWVKDSGESDGKWEPTHINETLDLLWSHLDEPALTLENGADRHLNVFFVENISRNMVTCTRLHVKLASAPSDRFKFDVRVAGEECPHMYILLEVTIGEAWSDLNDLHLGKGENVMRSV
jgi:hypothetical protein